MIRTLAIKIDVFLACLAVTMSDDQADGSGVRQSHHGNHAAVAAVLSVNMEVTLVKDACGDLVG